MRIKQAALLAVRDLLEQRVRIDHHAVAQHARLAGMADTGGHEVGDELLAVDHERVAGIRSAAVAHDDIGALGEQIDDLALALITPLSADDDDDRHQAFNSAINEAVSPARAAWIAGSATVSRESA